MSVGRLSVRPRKIRSHPSGASSLCRREFLALAAATASRPWLDHVLCAPGPPDTLDTVLVRHTSARGGASALDAVHAMTATLAITEGGGTVTACYGAMCAAHPATDARVRIDVFAPTGRVWSEGLDAAGCWSWAENEPGPHVATRGESALRRGVLLNLYGLHRFPALGAQLSYVGPRSVAATSYHVITATFADGFRMSFYIDSHDWMIARRRDVRPLHPDRDMTFRPIETKFWDYRFVTGVQTAFHETQTDLAQGKLMQEMTVTSLVFNPVLDVGRLARDAPPLLSS